MSDTNSNTNVVINKLQKIMNEQKRQGNNIQKLMTLQNNQGKTLSSVQKEILNVTQNNTKSNYRYTNNNFGTSELFKSDDGYSEYPKFGDGSDLQTGNYNTQTGNYNLQNSKNKKFNNNGTSKPTNPKNGSSAYPTFVSNDNTNPLSIKSNNSDPIYGGRKNKKSTKK